MAFTTGTTAFNPNLNEIFEEAFERAGQEMRSGYDFRTARRSLNYLLLEWANRGINMWTLEQGQIALLPGVATYDLPNDTVDLAEHVIRTGAGSVSTQVDLTISRISVSTYASIPNKLSPGRPIQVMVSRNSGQASPTTVANNPKITVWPVPNQGSALIPYFYFVYWRLRRLQDAGDGSNIVDIPFRFQEALVSGLAYKIALKLPNADPTRVQGLKTMYDEAWDLASSEDREKAPVRFVPRSFEI
jgi:hypothetical protein